MRSSTIYSIGHGNKKVTDFIDELLVYGIQYVLDVRSRPYSKWNPQFNQDSLQFSLNERGITYVFLGDALGGLPDHRDCYDSDGKVQYDKISEKSFFRKGLDRLITAHEKSIPLAIMCSESKPEECHRSKLIGQELLKRKISLNHIVAERKVKTQADVMNELTKGKGTTDLFGNDVSLTSRNSY